MSRKYHAEFVEFEEFEEFPSISFKSPLGSYPFKFKLKKSNARKRQPLGFCECCQIHYSDLDKHLK